MTFSNNVLTNPLLKFFKGNRPMARHKVVTNTRGILNKNFFKKLIFGKKNKAGRNNLGIITSFHRGGGVKKNQRIIDFYGRVFYSGIILSIEYDSARSSFLALVCNWKGFLTYRIAAHGLKRGQFLGIQKKGDFTERNGFICSIENVSIGSRIFHVEIFEGSGGRVARAAGTFCKLTKKLSRYGMLVYPSGKLKAVKLSFFCTLGRVSNIYRHLTSFGLAGVKRRLGFRPIVRGVAMNPVDHPHGGRTAGGRNPVSPWGRLTKSNYKSRKKVKVNKINLNFSEEFKSSNYKILR